MSVAELIFCDCQLVRDDDRRLFEEMISTQEERTLA